MKLFTLGAIVGTMLTGMLILMSLGHMTDDELLAFRAMP